MFSTALPFSLKSFFGLLYSLLFTIGSLLGAPSAGYTDEMPHVPEDFEPAIRFVVCTDSHTHNDTLVEMVNTCYDIYGEDGIDLFAHCGDFTENGADDEMVSFYETFYSAIGDNAETLIILGNHDLRSGYDAGERFLNLTGEVVTEQHKTVKGFHFIGIPSYTKSALQLAGPDKIAWARKQLKAAETESDGLPVFTFMHPHNRATVYGSVIWGTDAFNSVWEGHSRVVSFSGHSHYPIEDPRSIVQSSYTSVGAGAMARFELEKDLIWNQHPDKYDTAKEFYVVEADRHGAVKLQAYDLNTHRFFLTYFIENVNDPSTFAYTYKNRLAYDEAPVWGENANAWLDLNDSGETLLTFVKASDKLAVHDYKVTIKTAAGIPVYSKTFLSDYFLQDTPDTMTVNLGDLSSLESFVVLGILNYKVSITAVNSYYELSEPFTINLAYG